MLPVKLLSGQIFQHLCRCCLTKDQIMISVNTESTHNDNKTLADYLNVLFDYSGQNGGDLLYPSQICLRCSKALQIAYHFMLMSMDKKREFEGITRNSCKTLKTSVMGNPKEEENNYHIVIEFNNDVIGGTGGHELNNMEGCERNEGNMMDTIEDEEQKTVITKDVKCIEEGRSMNNSWECNEGKSDKNLKEENEKEQKIVDSIETEANHIPRCFKCCYCDNSFAYHESLIEHTQSIHKKMIPFKCKICSFYTCFIESLWKHYKKQHVMDDLENRLYRTQELLSISAEVEPSYEITLICKECNFQTHIQTEMDDHLAVQHVILEDKDIYITSRYNCPSCFRQFKDKTSVKIHYSMSHNAQQGVVITGVHNCEKCGKTFDRKTALVSHERRCMLLDLVACNFCGAEFSTVFKYEQHLQTTHSVDVKHECEVCRKTFKLPSSLAVHRRRHNERYYQCNLCPKNYINNAELQVHFKRIHSRHKMCSLCGKFFQQSSQLRDHKKTEHNKKIIQCGYCEFRSTSKFVIEVHQYRHTGRPYKCKCCPKQYVLRKDIKAHSTKVHGIELADEELAAMFVDKHGYPSRFDAFSKQNNLQIDVIDEMDLEMELKEFNLTFDDIINDLF